MHISKSSNDMGAVKIKIKILCPRNLILKTKNLLDSGNSKLKPRNSILEILED